MRITKRDHPDVFYDIWDSYDLANFNAYVLVSVPEHAEKDGKGKSKGMPWYANKCNMCLCDFFLWGCYIR